MVKVNPIGQYSVFDFNPRTGRFEERRGPRGSTYTDRAKDRDFGKRSGPHNPAALPGNGGYTGGRATRVMRAAGRLGLVAGRFHPVVRMTDLGIEAFNTISGQWAKISPDEYKLFDENQLLGMGFNKCQNNESPSAPGPCSMAYIDPVPGSACAVIPISWQAPPGHGATILDTTTGAMTGVGSAPVGTRVLRYGHYHNAGLPCSRVRVQGEYIRPTPITEPISFGITIPGRVIPVPLTTPPVPTMTESYTPAPRNRQRYKPYHRPSLEMEPGGRSRFVPHSRVKAPPGEKERKVNGTLRAALGAIAKLYDATTEASEIVDILYDNLGTKCAGARSMSQKANCVYRNLGTLNVVRAVAELAKNHYEDKVYGKIYGTVGKHTDFGAMLPGTSPQRDYGPVRNLSSRS